MLLYVNGQRRALKHAPPEMTLLQYLRQAGLTGTKLGCGEVSECVVECMRWVRTCVRESSPSNRARRGQSDDARLGRAEAPLPNVH